MTVKASTIRNGCCHALSILLASAMVIFFPVFRSHPLSLPTKWSLKDAQQMLNFLIMGTAVSAGLLMKHCLQKTNESETAADFYTSKLSFGKLQTRSEASKGSIPKLVNISWKDASVWPISTFYIFALSSFTGIAWVLSIVFVLDTVIVPQGRLQTTQTPLSSDVVHLQDFCSSQLTAAKCTYDLAASALSSQLITHTPYSIAGVTFSSPNGTRGLPFGVLQEFADLAQGSTFGSERSEYCLPVLDPKQYTCEQDIENTIVDYIYEGTLGLRINIPIWAVVVDPYNKANSTFIRQDNQNGTMTIYQSLIDPPNTTITASGTYAKVLSQLMYGNNMPTWVSFALENGIMNAEATGIACSSGKESNATGFPDLSYAIQGATSALGGIDGYSKLINSDPITQHANRAYAEAGNMSQLESILSQIYGIVQTSYVAAHLDTTSETTIQKKAHPHVFIVSVSWTRVTILAFIVSVFILLATVGQMVRWVIAVRMHEDTTAELELLQPLDLMAYSVQASDRLRELLATKSAREKLLRDREKVLLFSDMDDASSISVQSVEIRENETKVDSDEPRRSGLYRT